MGIGAGGGGGGWRIMYPLEPQHRRTGQRAVLEEATEQATLNQNLLGSNWQNAGLS